MNRNLDLETIFALWGLLYIVVFFALLFSHIAIRGRAENYQKPYFRRTGKIVRHRYCRNARTGFMEYSLDEVIEGIDRFGHPVETMKNIL